VCSGKSFFEVGRSRKKTRRGEGGGKLMAEDLGSVEEVKPAGAALGEKDRGET